jgi:hypothetical protein
MPAHGLRQWRKLFAGKTSRLLRAKIQNIPCDQGVTTILFSTGGTPGVAHAASAASSYSVQERTLPPNSIMSRLSIALAAE